MPVISTHRPVSQVCLTATCPPGPTTSSETPPRPTSGSFFPSTQWHLEGPDTQRQKEHDKETPGYGLKKVTGQHATSSLGGENQVREGRAEAPARALVRRYPALVRGVPLWLPATI